MKILKAMWTLSALLLVACGGGGGGGNGSSSATGSSASGGMQALSGATPGATNSGAITAFGSVFVNGHEFDISKATVTDDDTGEVRSDASGLEVGQVLDIKVASTSSDAKPVAQSLHLHPLVRGYVDASDTSSVTVMGQTVQLSATTMFSDHRACVFATTNPCTAVAGASDLATTMGSGAGATPGSYVVVDGYLFSSGGGAVNVIASLVAVFDAPPSTGAGAAAFKAEGSVSAIAGSTITIGGLSINLANAKCYAAGAVTPCASAFSVGQVVSAISAVAPSLPATSFDAQAALRRDRLPVTTAGATVELQGGVSAISGTSFTLRGITIDASSLPAGSSLPVVGDIVRVLGTVGTSGTSVTATSLQILRAAASASFAFEGDLANVAAGSAANTYTFTVLGQTVLVNAQTRLADFSTKNWSEHAAGGAPFNISTFQSYLAASSSQHVVVRTAADANGNLQALSVTLVKASGNSGLAGMVDASPTPVNSTTTGTPSTFSIHGVAISADPHAIQFQHNLKAISAGDLVLVRGSFAANVLSVGATRSFSNFVFDSGVPRTHDDPGF